MDGSETAKRGRGRPKGSTNKKGVSAPAAEASSSAATPRKRGRPRKENKDKEGKEGESGDEEEPSVKRKRGRPLKPQTAETSGGFRKRIEFGPADKSKPAKGLAPPTTQKKVAECVESDDEAPPAPTRKRKARRPVESEEEDEAPRSRRRRLKTPDEVCSGDEVESEHIIESRLRPRKLSQREFALLKMKAKRDKKSPPKTPEPESESADESEESERDSLFDGSSTSDFIVDDEGADAALLPKEFRMDAHEDLSVQFKKIFQLFVHVAVRAPTERKEFMEKTLETDEYFSMAFNGARRRISSLRVTLVASSRWEPDFIARLEKYPEFQMKDSSSTPACDVCNVKSRRGCKIAELSGFPYESAGFEEKKNKKRGKLEFKLGRFCAERVRIYHQIAHWENEVFKTIIEEVNQLHERKMASGIIDDRDKFVPAKYLGGKEPPEDLGDADAINQWLVDRSIVDMEWDKIKLMMDDARNCEDRAKKDQTD
ncbi:hypothetical protein DFH07DRAFT_800109 [Mycena maculata]|uniref:DUF4211 domain-containing protein n=1 Tax=Mycena maculata TaxID=230809 RepID=A0AAD7K2M7_9AGAR|nr:hypothetical protein DFH07DRAFT_800109 [Mycena maculata]